MSDQQLPSYEELRLQLESLKQRLAYVQQENELLMQYNNSLTTKVNLQQPEIRRLQQQPQLGNTLQPSSSSGSSSTSRASSANNKVFSSTAEDDRLDVQIPVAYAGWCQQPHLKSYESMMDYIAYGDAQQPGQEDRLQHELALLDIRGQQWSANDDDEIVN